MALMSVEISQEKKIYEELRYLVDFGAESNSVRLICSVCLWLWISCWKPVILLVLVVWWCFWTSDLFCLFITIGFKEQMYSVFNESYLLLNSQNSCKMSVLLLVMTGLHVFYVDPFGVKIGFCVGVMLLGCKVSPEPLNEFISNLQGYIWGMV